jgi:cytochrome c553
MSTTEGECLDALREAATRLGESPTKAAYEELGLTPSASTILRVVGGWNEAKERAGLATNASRGSRVQPKPDDVTIPEDVEWAELSQDQRWHYRNVEWNTERTLRRRAELRAWVNDRKAERGCADCGLSDPACLDLHHREAAEKEMEVTEMVTHGYAREKLRVEMEKCVVLCASCHRKQHDRRPTVVTERRTESSTKRERLQRWSFEYRRERGCERCDERDPVCLQFHHPENTNKRRSVGGMIADSYPEENVRAEADRCVVLCANCHRREHFEPPESYRDDPTPTGDEPA